jgi:hypothetical protein
LWRQLSLLQMGKLRFDRNSVLRVEKLKGYFGKPKATLKKQFENAQKKGVVEEEDGDGEGGDGDGGEPRRKKKRTKGASPTASEHLQSAKTKLAAQGGDVAKAASGAASKVYLNVNELKALLKEAGGEVNGSRSELAARLVSKLARPAGTAADTHGDATTGARGDAMAVG